MLNEDTLRKLHEAAKIETEIAQARYSALLTKGGYAYAGSMDALISAGVDYAKAQSVEQTLRFVLDGLTRDEATKQAAKRAGFLKN